MGVLQRFYGTSLDEHFEILLSPSAMLKLFTSPATYKFVTAEFAKFQMRHYIMYLNGD